MKSVVIIDDHDIVRYGMEMLIAGTEDMRVAGAAASLHEGLEMIARLKPDLVITDMGTGDSHGLDTVRQVVAAQASRPVLVVSMQDEMLYGERVIALGALGYLMKESKKKKDAVTAFKKYLELRPDAENVKEVGDQIHYLTNEE